MKYRKKPVEIEAFVWTGNFEQKEDPVWIVQAIDSGTVVIPHYEDSAAKYGFLAMEIKTLEGVMIAKQGDYVIQGVQGEIYPCKPDIFEATYEKV
ncbi:hypothetical protein PGRAN_02610 [Listeria grandensis FSL F6-0971]|uniref:Phage protein n=1 Tax=Listeria grandensis FSL F6-0971 TaxID=1265819 RepID=W7BNX7_9LIST|nr:hypothetical protein [Listeria grandensis]EUJ24751.1 hypothetical protein PGRAN_02610 [Listeria grandensis FSL F6-0971]